MVSQNRTQGRCAQIEDRCIFTFTQYKIFHTHYLGWYTQGQSGRVDNCDVSEGVRRYMFINYQLLVRNGNMIESTLPSLRAQYRTKFTHLHIFQQLKVKVFSVSEVCQLCDEQCCLFLQLCSLVEPLDLFLAICLYLYWKIIIHVSKNTESTGQCPFILKLVTWTYIINYIFTSHLWQMQRC